MPGAGPDDEKPIGWSYLGAKVYLPMGVSCYYPPGQAPCEEPAIALKTSQGWDDNVEESEWPGSLTKDRERKCLSVGSCDSETLSLTVFVS